MNNTYKLFIKIKELKDASKSPRLTRAQSWELCLLAEQLERKYNFLVQLRKELNKYDNNKTK